MTEYIFDFFNHRLVAKYILPTDQPISSAPLSLCNILVKLLIAHYLSLDHFIASRLTENILFEVILSL